MFWGVGIVFFLFEFVWFSIWDGLGLIVGGIYGFGILEGRGLEVFWFFNDVSFLFFF